MKAREYVIVTLYVDGADDETPHAHLEIVSLGERLKIHHYHPTKANITKLALLLRGKDFSFRPFLWDGLVGWVASGQRFLL